MKKKIIDLGALYFGKIGALAVGFFLMPAYSFILGPTQFATVAFILSLVNAAITLDFGMSIIIGRDSSDTSISPERNYKQLQVSLALITFFYIVIFIISIIYGLFTSTIINNWQIQFFSLVLILSSLIQNITVSYLNGIKEFRISGLVLFFSVTVRGVISLLVIKYIKNDINYFMSVQALLALFFAIIFVWLTSLFNKRESCGNLKVSNYLNLAGHIPLLWPLAKKGFPLLFMGISATLVMQLDKMTLAHFAPEMTLSAYYLAFTFSTIPILAVAGPIKQYFQPHIVSNLTNKSIVYRKYSLTFFWCLIIFVVAPSTFGYSFLKPIIGLWLGDNVLIEQVVNFSLVLLPAFTIGALSYFPSVLLVVAEDYKFQSVIAILTSIFFAIAVLLFSFENKFNAIPWLFIIYFLSVIVIFCLRCVKLKKITDCLVDVLKHSPLAVIVIACAYGIGYVASLLLS